MGGMRAGDVALVEPGPPSATQISIIRASINK